MSKEFDKNKFKKSQMKLLIACFTIGLIGIVSIICSFLVGNGIKFETAEDKVEREYQEFLDAITPDEDDDFGEDPKDYYGDYYFEKDFVIQKLSVTKDGVEVTISNIFESKTESFSYKYASKEYAKETFQKSSPVLILYEDDISEYKTMWLNKSKSGKYTITDNEGIKYTTKEKSLDKLWEDPKDYM